MVQGGLISLFSSLRSMFGSKEAFVQFGDGQKIQTEAGTSILEVALSNDIELENFCEGCCSCSTCRIEVVSGGQYLSKMQQDEANILGEKRVLNGDRLACQAKINGPVQVKIPDMF